MEKEKKSFIWVDDNLGGISLRWERWKACLLVLLNKVGSISANNEKELKCNKLCQIFSTNPRFWSFVGILFYCQASAESLFLEQARWNELAETNPLIQARYTGPDERSPVKRAWRKEPNETSLFLSPQCISRLLESAALAWTRTWDDF